MDNNKTWYYRKWPSAILHGVHVAAWFLVPTYGINNPLVGVICGTLALAFYVQREDGDWDEYPDDREGTTLDLWIPWMSWLACMGFVILPKVG